MTRRARLTRLAAPLALVALALPACGNDDSNGATGADEATGATGATEAPDATPDAIPDAAPDTETTDDGVVVTSPDRDFVVTFPGEPVADSVEVPVDPTLTVTTEILAYETADGDALLASWVDYPDDFDSSDSDAVLEGARDGALDNVAGELTESEFITLDGRPGISFAADVEMMGVNGIYLARTFIDDTRLYQVVAIGTADTGFEADGTAFLDSFQFTGEGRGETP